MDRDATRALGALFKGRSDGGLTWRADGDDKWIVGTFIFLNDAKFAVRQVGGMFTVARLWMGSGRGDQPEPKPLGESRTRDEVEERIRRSLAEDGPYALVYAAEGAA